MGRGDRKKLMPVEEEPPRGIGKSSSRARNNRQLAQRGQRALDNHNMDTGISALELLKTPHRFGGGGDRYVPPKRMAIRNKPANTKARKTPGYRRKF
jgi:hypothetical protein